MQIPHFLHYAEQNNRAEYSVDRSEIIRLRIKTIYILLIWITALQKRKRFQYFPTFFCFWGASDKKYLNMIKKVSKLYQIFNQFISTVKIFFTKFCQIQINHYNGLNFLLFISLWIIKPCIKLNFKCNNNAATTHVNGVDFRCTFYD